LKLDLPLNVKGPTPAVDSARHPRAGEGSGREIGHTRLTSTIAFFRVCATCNHSTLPTTREETNTQKSGAWLFPVLRLGQRVQSRNTWVCRKSQQGQFDVTSPVAGQQLVIWSDEAATTRRLAISTRLTQEAKG
jgi:hypothetical protein